jgi:DNA replication protein DnaC
MSSHSSLDALHQAIQDCNPFESNFITRSYQVWDDDFLDMPSLQASASTAILDTVNKINTGQLKSGTAGVVLLAPKGVGKTHVISRIRHHLKDNGGGFFIYMCEYGNLHSIKQKFLQDLASGLKKLGRSSAMQWQELATTLILSLIHI